MSSKAESTNTKQFTSSTIENAEFNNERHHQYTPQNRFQQKLLEHTQSLLSTDKQHPIGSLSLTKIIDVSNCMNQWINSGEHRYLGAEQAELLVKRLIMERGGGKSLGSWNENELEENDAVVWEMFNFESVCDLCDFCLFIIINFCTLIYLCLFSRKILNSFFAIANFPSYFHYATFIATAPIYQLINYFNSIYNGKEFIDRVLSIVSTFEQEYVYSSNATIYDYDSNQDIDSLEVPYKSIIASLCKCHTVHAAGAAEQILHRFESRLLVQSQSAEHDVGTSVPYYHSNPPTVETYNNVISCWMHSGSSFYPQSCEPQYYHHPNPISNILSQMLNLSIDAPQNMSRIRPNSLTFNMAITSLSKWQMRSNDFHSNNQCFDHLMTMIKFYKEGHHDCAPDIATFSTVLNALETDRRKGYDILAKDVLEEMLHLSGVVDSAVRGRQKAQPATQQSHNNSKAEESYQSSSWEELDVIPRNKHFNIVLALMADTNRVSDATLDYAKQLVQLMEEISEKVDQEPEHLPQRYQLGIDEFQTAQDSAHTSSKPDTITYNTLIKIAARAGKPNVAEEILEDMLEKSSNEVFGVKPDRITFNTVSIVVLIESVHCLRKP